MSEQELTEEELERLDRALRDEPGLDEDPEELDQPASDAILGASKPPPDLRIEFTEEEEPEDVWLPVSDLGSPDVEVNPAVEQTEERSEDVWAAVDDADEPDVALATQLEEDAEDIWGPTVSGALQSVSSHRREVGFQLPRRPKALPEAPAPRVLPWRGAAELVSPALPDLACEADPSATTSLLLVAAWEWTDEAERTLRFRLSDKGEPRNWDVDVPHEPVVKTTVRLLGQEHALSLRIAVAHDRRGLVLGRDLLAGRFLVDPAADSWD